MMRMVKNRLGIALVAAFCLTLLGSPAYGAEKYYLRIEGLKQGPFKGGVARNGSRWIEIIAFSAGAESPRDAASGQASGKRQHKPIVITKEIDEASPQLLQAVTTNELLKEVVIQSVRPDPKGKGQVYQTITLTNAAIAKVKGVSGKNKNEEERFQFTFQKIEVTDVQGKKTATDDWLASN
jgi:type VI secretion system secreted protein Hcp